MSGTRRTDSDPQAIVEPAGEARHANLQASRRGLLAGAAAALGAGGLPVVAGAAPGADADIIATCDRYVTAELEWRRLLYAGDSPEYEAAAQDFSDGEYGEALEAAAELPPALTIAGLLAKARTIVAFYDPYPPDSGCVLDAALWEVLTTLAGPELLAKLHRQRPMRSEVES